MALSIKHPEANRLARELTRQRGCSITEAVMAALEAELARERKRVRTPETAGRLLAIGRRYAALPDLETRSDDEILGYDDRGPAC